MQVPVVYTADEQFQIGKAKILRQAEGDQVSWLGVTLIVYLGFRC